MNTDAKLRPIHPAKTLLERTDIETLTYEYRDDFMIDIVKTVSDGIGDYWDVWLYHKDYGYKEYLFGIPMNTEPQASMEQVLEQIEVNLESENYIEEYRNEFIETVYTVIEIEEDIDFGCEERSDNTPVMALVTLRDDSGTEKVIRYPDKELYHMDINEGDRISWDPGSGFMKKIG